MFLVSHFKAVEASPLPEGEIQFVGIPNLEDHDVVLGVAEVGQAVHDGIEVAKAIGYDEIIASGVLDSSFLNANTPHDIDTARYLLGL